MGATVPSAEDIYLFRHAIYREVAYQLQVPSARSLLHVAAIGVIECEFRGQLERVARELADHAGAAQDGAALSQIAELQQLETQFLYRAMMHAVRTHQAQAALATSQRILALPCFWRPIHASAAVEAANIYRSLGRGERADESFALCIELATAEHSYLLVAEALVSRTNLALQVGNIEAARRWHREAEAAAERTSDAGMVGWVMATRANFLDIEGDIAGAEQTLRQALKLLDGSTHRNLTLATRGNLANLLSSSGRREEAIAEYRALIEAFRRADNEVGTSIAQSNLGRQLLLTGKLEEAEWMIRLAMDTIQQAGMRNSYAFCASNLAEVHSRTGRLEEARDLLAQASDIAREHGVHQRYAATLASQAGLELLCGHEQAAHELIERSRTEFEVAASAVYIPEFCDIWRLRIAVSSATTAKSAVGTSRLRAEPPQRRWLVIARELLGGMERAYTALKLKKGTLLEESVFAGRALLAELESAINENRPATVFRGWLPAEFRPELKHALLDRMQQRSPAEFSAMKRFHPALWKAMQP
ncbi:MAG: tetratricopeptide repeat protein [Planctomycetes bacterium]|nr:tetratricopeptide repeat protein [Planctomycetota bacterium]